jgi:amylosucrase
MDADLDIGDGEVDERARRLWPIAEQSLGQLYGSRDDFQTWRERIYRQVHAAAAARPADLRAADRMAERQGGWWKAPSVVGYSAYVDRFAGDLAHLEGRLGYLKELGVTYLHLLPLLKAREGDSDGGFAVADFGAVDPRLGSMADLEGLARSARKLGIGLVLDLVCNHTADEHAWARAARAGDPEYRAYYHVLADQAEVSRYEQRLIDVFPEVAPGNFTFCEQMGGWVWTTFYPFQWDLNYANPAVFCEMLAVMLRLANLGIQGLRLDSAPFLWKRAGADCRNQPETHHILAAWRALLSIAAPSVALKAEAIERIEDVTSYFGGQGGPPECDLAYNNGVMTALWASLALGSARPARLLIEAAMAKPAAGTWINYIRCHDDIIWSALSPFVPLEEQVYCSRFFAGLAGPSYSSGAAFQGVPGAAPSTNGMAASLVGIAGQHPDAAAVARLLLLYGVAYALDGAPLIWMGDEIALGNQDGDPDAPASRDGRWLQRPAMDWERAALRTDPSLPAGQVFQYLAGLARTRAGLPAFAAEHPARVGWTGSPAVLSFVRGPGPDAVQCLANFSAEPSQGELAEALARGGSGWTDLVADEKGEGAGVPLGPYQVRWLVRTR